MIGATQPVAIEITRFTKVDGPLTKRISLTPDGKPASDGSACLMARGSAERMRCASLGEFAEVIGQLQSNQAIGLGALRDDLPEQTEIVTAHKLTKLNGTTTPNLIARTADAIAYRPERPALVLFDFDKKGMPPAVAARIEAAGGFWPALVAAFPPLATVGRVERVSTSAALYRTDTSEPMPGSGGLHDYVIVRDGADAVRFLKTLHERVWLAGLGWMMVGAGGQFLDRSAIDRTVGTGERLVFEAPPILEPPIAQNSTARQPIVHDGDVLDTVAACPPLTIVERARLGELQSRERQRLAAEAATTRKAFVKSQAERIAERTGLPPDDAARVAERWCSGILLPHVVLPFDDPELEGGTVADVLAEPEKFVGATLADPLEGIAYGVCKAKVMQRADGTPWIHSFAHGRTVYELRHDAAHVRAAIERCTKGNAARTFSKIVQLADIEPGDREQLRDMAAKRDGINKRTVEQTFKEESERHRQSRAREERDRQQAERLDSRPQIPAPPPDAPWLPQMSVLNEVLGASRDPEPPARDINGNLVEIRVRPVPNTHALTSRGANGDEPEDDRLPPPEQPLLTVLSETRAAELIERHIDYVDPIGRSVHLGAAFVRHFMNRADGLLPTFSAIATLPLVLGDGTLLACRGLDRERKSGIVFRVPRELMALIPHPEDCHATAVAEAMQFLADTWLCDVATNYTGKAVLIALALSIIERSLLPERPMFFVTAGRRGGGKTTVLSMLLMAVTGVRPSASAWSPNEEERRKALLAYLMEGLPAIIWDNIPRGTTISCPHVEKSCTADHYSDRRLGVSETVSVPASLIHCFTGNNIAAKGDSSSRSLEVRIEVDRPDPENRPFRHPDPVGWTQANRGQILKALYTILVGNPVLRPGANKPAETRFKTWWRLVGAAVEHAADQHAQHVEACTLDRDRVWDRNATCPPKRVSFKDLFLAGEQDDEDSANLADLLEALVAKWPEGAQFRAADLAKVVNDQSDPSYRLEADTQLAAVVREVFYPKAPPSAPVTARSVGKALSKHVGEPIRSGDRVLILKEHRDTNTGAKSALAYYVETKG